MTILVGLLAFSALVAVVVILVALYREIRSTRGSDSFFDPAHRRRRLLLTTALVSVLFPSIGARRGIGGVLAGLAFSALAWLYCALTLRRFDR